MPKGVRTPSARHALPRNEPTWDFDVPPPDNIADPYGEGRRAGVASPLVQAARYWNNRAAAMGREQMGPNYPNYYDCEGPSFMGYGSEAQRSAALHDDLSSIWGSQREGPVGPAGVVKDDPGRRGASVPTNQMGGPPAPNPHPYFYGGLRRPEGQRHLPAPDVYFYQPPVHQYMPSNYPSNYYNNINPYQYPQPVRTEPYIEVVPPPKPDPPAGTLPPEVGDKWWKCTSERHNTPHLTTQIKATVLAKQLAEEEAPPPPTPPASGIKAAVLTKHLMNVEQSKVHPYSGVDESQVKAELGAAAAAKAEADAAEEATRQDIVNETLSVIPLSLRPHIMSLMPSLNGTVLAPPPPEIPEAIPGKSAYFDREVTRVMEEKAVETAVEASKVPPPPPFSYWLPPPPTIDQSITMAVNAEMSRILGRPFEAPPAPPPPTTLEDVIKVEVNGAMSRILGRPCRPAKGEPADSTFAATIDEVVKNELSRVLPFGLPADPEAPTWEGAVAAAVQEEVSKVYGVPPSGSPPPPRHPAPTTWEGAVASAVQQEMSKLHGVPPPPPPPTAWESAVAAAVEKEMSRVQGYPPQSYGGAYPPGYHLSQLHQMPRDHFSPSHHQSALHTSHRHPHYDHRQYDRLSPLRNQEPIPRALPRNVIPKRPLRSAEASADELALQELLTESQCVVGGRDLLRRLPRRAPSMLHTSPPRPTQNDDAEPQAEEESYIFNGDELRAALEEAGDEEAVHCVVRRDQSRACGAAGSWVRMQRREGPTRHALGCAAPPPIDLVGGAEDAPTPTNASVAAMSAFMGLRDQAASRRQVPPQAPAHRAQAPVYGEEPPVVAAPPAAVPAKRTLPVSTATMLARKRAAAAAAAKADVPPPSQAPPSQPSSQPSLQDFFKQRKSKLEEERRQAELNEPPGPDSVPPPSRKLMGEDAPVLPL